MKENEVARSILDAAFVVHTKLGPRLLESVYEVVLAHELRKAGLTVERQKAMPIVYDGIRFEEAFRSDLVVEGTVIAELKSVVALTPIHGKQLLTQLRLGGLKLVLEKRISRTASSESSTGDLRRISSSNSSFVTFV